MRTDINVRTPGGLRVTGITTGPGTPDTPLLVCLPGGSYTARYFDVPGFSLLEVAEANGFTAIALARPGHGGRRPPPPARLRRQRPPPGRRADVRPQRRGPRRGHRRPVGRIRGRPPGNRGDLPFHR